MLLNAIVKHVPVFGKFAEESVPILEKLEEVTDSVVVPLLFGVHRFIDEYSVDSIYEVFSELRCVRSLSIVLASGGGNVDEAYLLACYLQKTVDGKLTIYVPRYAKSAATLLACCGDEIVMLPIAELGPIDPVLYDERSGKYVPLQSILELIDMLASREMPRDLVREILDKLPVIEFGDYKRAVDHNIELATKILEKRMFKGNPERAKAVARHLVSYKQHGAAITVEDAKEVGLKVRLANEKESKLLWKLHNLWKTYIVLNEYDVKTDEWTPVEFKLGKGIVLTITSLQSFEAALKEQK